MKITKSWALTIASVVFAIIAPPLADAGIIIPEEQVDHYMLLFFGISGIGAGVSVRKAVRPTPKAETPEPKPPVQGPLPEPVKVVRPEDTVPSPNQGYVMSQRPLGTDQANRGEYTGTSDDWFRTDLTYKKDVGAVMYTDDPFLWIKVEGSKKIDGYVERSSDKRKIQIDHGTDELRLNMYTHDKDGIIVPFEPGRYKFHFGAYYDLKGFPKPADGYFTLMVKED